MPGAGPPATGLALIVGSSSSWAELVRVVGGARGLGLGVHRLGWVGASGFDARALRGDRSGAVAAGGRAVVDAGLAHVAEDRLLHGAHDAPLADVDRHRVQKLV